MSHLIYLVSVLRHQVWSLCLEVLPKLWPATVLKCLIFRSLLWTKAEADSHFSVWVVGISSPLSFYLWRLRLICPRFDWTHFIGEYLAVRRVVSNFVHTLALFTNLICGLLQYHPKLFHFLAFLCMFISCFAWWSMIDLLNWSLILFSHVFSPGCNMRLGIPNVVILNTLIGTVLNWLSLRHHLWLLP